MAGKRGGDFAARPAGEASDAQTAESHLVEQLYQELRALAGEFMRGERPNHTLQPTALVHEALLRLARERTVWSTKSHGYLIGAAAKAMRRVLVDHARRRKARKRGGPLARVPLDVALDCFEEQNADILVLDELLDELARRSRRQHDVVMLRCFGGMTMPRIAKHLGVSLSTAEGNLRLAKAWLRSRLAEGAS